MRKLVKFHSEDLGLVKLYLDDIEEIVEILSEASKEIKLTTSEYALDNVGELANLHCEYITELKITSSNPYVTIEFRPSGIQLYISEDTHTSRGIFEKVKSLIQSRRRLLSPLLENPLVAGVVAGVPFGVSFSLLLNLLLSRERITAISWPVIVYSVLLCLAVVWAWWAFRIRLWQYSLIILKKRFEERSFWQRNSDRLAIGVILTLISGLLALLIKGL